MKGKCSEIHAIFKKNETFGQFSVYHFDIKSVGGYNRPNVNAFQGVRCVTRSLIPSYIWI